MLLSEVDWSESDVPHWEHYLNEQESGVDIEELKSAVKKLNAQATNLKMNLHDLAEDLPTGWETIPNVAEQTYETYKRLMDARQKLAEAGG